MEPPGPRVVAARGLARLSARFDRDYGVAYARLAAELEARYPDITREGRRTGRALRNICFFVWSYARDGDEPHIPALLDASVLLSAQDDFYDNRRIPDVQKEAFRAAVDRFVRGGSVPPRASARKQPRELLALWSAVARPVRAASPPLHAHWKREALRLNAAMAVESRVLRNTTITLDEYLRTAVHSIGIVFVWSTYLVHKNVPSSTLLALHDVIPVGAGVVRLSNDIASYRQGKRTNAVILLGGGRDAEARVMERIARESRVFRERLEPLAVAGDVKRVLLRSVDFLREFYQRSDFDEKAMNRMRAH